MVPKTEDAPVPKLLVEWATTLQPLAEELRALSQDALLTCRMYSRKRSRLRIHELTLKLAARLESAGVKLTPQPGCARWTCTGCAECERVAERDAPSDGDLAQSEA